MSSFTDPFTPESIRQLLQSFWRDALEFESTRTGLSLAVPQTLPDGWQMVVDLDDHLPGVTKLTDRGRTLTWLSAQGYNVDSPAITRHLNEICQVCGVERDGLELFRWFPKGIEGVDIHVFADALVNIAHLHYLRDLKPRTLDIPETL